MHSTGRWILAAVATATFGMTWGGAAETAQAQQLELPRKSQLAKVSLVVGVTEVELTYSSPAKRGRKVWGELVPYGKVWRTGANAATLIRFSHPVTFGGKKVDAGTYSLFTVPGPKQWTVMLNSKTGMSGTQYDAKHDVLKTKATSTPGPDRERMTFVLSDSTHDAVNLDLEWAGKRVRVPIRIDTKGIAKANIDAALGSAWRPHYQAGRYMLEDANDPAKAIAYFDASLQIKPTWWASWFKALALEKQRKPADAVASAKAAQRLGKGDRVYESFFKKRIAEAIARWGR